jgi:hypothetical protein
VKKLLLIALFAAACGNKQTPAPTPTPAGCGEGAPATAEQCECHGWQVVGDIGDGQVECPDGTSEVSRIQYGIEGGVCCMPAPAAE